MRLLGIETSCDETAAAVVEMNHGRFSVLSNVVSSQIKIHAKTGGVVPEVAARAHVEKIIPVIKKALTDARLQAPLIDAIAVTTGPGLITSLLVGVEAARTLSYIWKKSYSGRARRGNSPLVAVNHLEGHIYANFLSEKIREFPISNFQFPILCLIVSGGHTELVLMKKHLDYQVIGATRDDAAGECFDKVAKMLGLGYPGGPAIAAEAETFQHNVIAIRQLAEKQSPAMVWDRRGRPRGLPRDDMFVGFPRPMIDSPDFDFSFAGLKTAVLYQVLGIKGRVSGIKNLKPKINLPTGQAGNLKQVCYEFQEAVVDVLVSKTIRAAKKYKVNTIMLGGGVAANQRLRQRLGEVVTGELSNTRYMIPDIKYTGDNAAMIAAAGYFHALKKDFTPWQKLEVDPNWELGQKMGKL